MKKLVGLLSIVTFCILPMLAIASNEERSCVVHVSVASDYSYSVVFNAQKPTAPQPTYTTTAYSSVSPGSATSIIVPCASEYNISASPNSVASKNGIHLPGTFTYTGNPVYLADGANGGVSVTFPNDFKQIQ